MKSIALLANSDDMLSVAKDAAKHAGAEDEIELILTHTYEESLEIARKYEARGGSMLIARGGHARILREAGIGKRVGRIRRHRQPHHDPNDARAGKAHRSEDTLL